MPQRQLGDGSGQTFLETALAGTGRFRPRVAAQDETTLALRANNTEFAKRLAESEQRDAAFQEDVRVQAHKFQEEMRLLVRTSLARNAEVETAAEARNAATQKQLGALVNAAKTLPDGAQVLLLAAASAKQSDAIDAGTAEEANAGCGEAAGEVKAPSDVVPHAGAPPAPEHSDGLDDHGAPVETPLSDELPARRRITTPTKIRLIPGLQQLFRNASRADHASSVSLQQEAHGDAPAPGPTDRPRHRPRSTSLADDVPSTSSHLFFGRPGPRRAQMAPTQSATAIHERTRMATRSTQAPLDPRTVPTGPRGGQHPATLVTHPARTRARTRSATTACATRTRYSSLPLACFDTRSLCPP